MEFFVQNGDTRRALHEQLLRKVPDLVKLCGKFEQASEDAATKKADGGGEATLTDCHTMYTMAALLPCLAEQIAVDATDLVRTEFLARLQLLELNLEKFVELVEATIDLEHPDENREYVIRHDYTPELNELHTQLEELHAEADRELNKAVSKLDVDNKGMIKLEDTATGFFLKVSKNNEKCFRNEHEYESFGRAKNDGCRYVNDELRRLNKDFVVVRKAYQDAQTTIERDVLETSATYAPTFRKMANLIAFLDVLVALAVAAECAPTPYVKPTMLPQGSRKLCLKQVRHPTVDANRTDFIANDADFDESSSFWIITGPNMGGKSTYILSVGIAVLLAQIGSFVPAAEATISVVDGIYTRVGGSDTILKGTSTFMNEMQETKAILDEATAHSLIIIDELGRGTSTYDGFGLAWAISEHIATTLRSFCLFATHYHELTDMAKRIDSVKNAHVAAMTTDDELMMLYQVKPGPCDQSFGVHVAKLARFPSVMIDHAQEKLDELEGLQLDKKSKDNVDAWLEKLKNSDVDAMSDADVAAFVELINSS